VKRVIVDTGPLVAYFDRDSAFHGWTCAQFKQLSEPLFSCQPVLTETLFLLKRYGMDTDLPLAMVERGELHCDFDIWREAARVRRLLRKYRDLPATLADACLVRMSEFERDCAVFTLDQDFLVYRRNGRQTIPLLAPFA
jgi:predicted nucleic acid-binding protein